MKGSRSFWRMVKRAAEQRKGRTELVDNGNGATLTAHIAGRSFTFMAEAEGRFGNLMKKAGWAAAGDNTWTK